MKFCISTQFSSIWPINRILSGATTPGQSGPGSNGNKEGLCFPQSSSITGTSPSDSLVSYPGHSLGRSYTSAEVYSEYSTAPVHWESVTGVGIRLLPGQNLALRPLSHGRYTLKSGTKLWNPAININENTYIHHILINIKHADNLSGLELINIYTNLLEYMQKIRLNCLK